MDNNPSSCFLMWLRSRTFVGEPRYNLASSFAHIEVSSNLFDLAHVIDGTCRQYEFD